MKKQHGADQSPRDSSMLLCPPMLVSRQIIHAERRAASPSHDARCARTKRLQTPSHLLLKQRKKPHSDEVRCGRATAHSTMALVTACFGRMGVAVCVNSRLAHNMVFRIHGKAG